jgi:hydrogenase expression/formation protein HypE
LELEPGWIAFTTDSYVVSPIFFPGGNIGKLAICGTVNDLAVVGAIPKYLSCGFILEEGLPLKDFREIVQTMAEEAKAAGVTIVTGDTKVVERGSCDKIFINTSGIGLYRENSRRMATAMDLQEGDAILINGSIAEHGIAVMSQRQGMNLKTTITSDCAALHTLIGTALEVCPQIRFMRDATRGGLATVLCELIHGRGLGVDLAEEGIPIQEEVRGYCEMLGFDPLYVANEGKVLMVVPRVDVDKVLAAMKAHPLGSLSAVIGEVTKKHPGMVVMKTSAGGSRIVDMLSGAQLPRIC